MAKTDLDLRSCHFTEKQNEKVKALSLLSPRVLAIAVINAQKQKDQMLEALELAMPIVEHQSPTRTEEIRRLMGIL